MSIGIESLPPTIYLPAIDPPERWDLPDCDERFICELPPTLPSPELAYDTILACTQETISGSAGIYLDSMGRIFVQPNWRTSYGEYREGGPQPAIGVTILDTTDNPNYPNFGEVVVIETDPSIFTNHWNGPSTTTSVCGTGIISESILIGFGISSSHGIPDGAPACMQAGLNPLTRNFYDQNGVVHTVTFVQRDLGTSFQGNQLILPSHLDERGVRMVTFAEQIDGLTPRVAHVPLDIVLDSLQKQIKSVFPLDQSFNPVIIPYRTDQGQEIIDIIPAEMIERSPIFIEPATQPATITIDGNTILNPDLSDTNPLESLSNSQATSFSLSLSTGYQATLIPPQHEAELKRIIANSLDSNKIENSFTDMTRTSIWSQLKRLFTKEPDTIHRIDARKSTYQLSIKDVLYLRIDAASNRVIIYGTDQYDAMYRLEIPLSTLQKQLTDQSATIIAQDLDHSHDVEATNTIFRSLLAISQSNRLSYSSSFLIPPENATAVQDLLVTQADARVLEQGYHTITIPAFVQIRNNTELKYQDITIPLGAKCRLLEVIAVEGRLYAKVELNLPTQIDWISALPPETAALTGTSGTITLLVPIDYVATTK